MIRDYRPQGVAFYYIYKALAHPELNGYVTPYTLDERLRHVQEAQRRIPTQAVWLCDTMANDLKHALGDAPNSEFVLDPEGIVVRRRAWSDPQALRNDLEELVGPVERPTKVEDLDVRFTPPPRVSASGVVPRLTLPPGLQPVRIEPAIQADGLPFYVKLRAEAEPSLLRDGKGKLYLGFHLDPIYRVHWNNLIPPLRFRIEPDEAMRVEPGEGSGPKVEVEADVDPREFLVDVDRTGGGRSLRLTVNYAACQDDEGWCRVLEQTYRVVLEPDPDGGRAMRGPRPGPAGPRPLPPNRARLISGIVVEVNAARRELTIRDEDDRPRHFRVAEDAMLRGPTGPARLDDVVPGDQVLIDVDPATRSDQRPLIRRMRARPTEGRP